MMIEDHKPSNRTFKKGFITTKRGQNFKIDLHFGFAELAEFLKLAKNLKLS